MPTPDDEILDQDLDINDEDEDDDDLDDFGEPHKPSDEDVPFGRLQH